MTLGTIALRDQRDAVAVVSTCVHAIERLSLNGLCCRVWCAWQPSPVRSGRLTYSPNNLLWERHLLGDDASRMAYLIYIEAAPRALLLLAITFVLDILGLTAVRVEPNRGVRGRQHHTVS
jgi:hypothetical protein